ncbi:unnamed protein product, partial [Vitis vinifera]|uniref:Uncharacterized protein n=1 Tax=Vitis vinifera TaxID=29760 RepID=D7T683_VITVI
MGSTSITLFHQGSKFCPLQSKFTTLSILFRLYYHPALKLYPGFKKTKKTKKKKKKKREEERRRETKKV